VRQSATPPPPPPPPLTYSLSPQPKPQTYSQQQPDPISPPPQNSGLAPLPSFAVPARLGATNSPAPPTGWTPSPNSPSPSPAPANYSLKPVITTSKYLLGAIVNSIVNDSRWKFKDDGMLPHPRPYSGIIKDYKSGRRGGSTVPLDLHQFT
jgi:hypothetical protein